MTDYSADTDPVDFDAPSLLKYTGGDDAALQAWYGTLAGYDTIGGDGVAYSQAAAEFGALADGVKLKTLDACILFMEKPVDLLITGRSKKMTAGNLAEKGKVDVATAAFLPKLTATELGARTAQQVTDMTTRRAAWPNEFKNVNMSKVKRIALLGLQLSPKYTKVMKEWRKVYSGRPCNATIPAKVTGVTRTIKQAEIDQFIQAKSQWNTAAIAGHFAMA